MTRYVLISAGNRLESPDAANTLSLGKQLAERGHDVALFFVQNGVFAAAGTDADVDAAAAAGVRLFVDQFGLQERGLGQPRHPAFSAASLDFVVDRLEAGDKVIWQ